MNPITTTFLRRFAVLPAVAAALLFLGAPVARADDPPRHRPPAVLDTDIGDDIDDTWALALLLRSEELDLKLVTTDYGKPQYRAKIAAKLLETAGRTDVAVGLGPKVQGVEGEGGQAAWVKGYDLGKYPGKVHQDGVQAIIDLVLGSPEEVTLICIGPLPTIAAALEREPRIAGKARFVGMHGSVRNGYGGKPPPDPEWNVKAAPAACRKAFTAAWKMTITPLDTCGRVQLRGEKYRKLLGVADPLTRAVIENYRTWCGNDPGRADRESSTLFDTVAVYLAASPDRGLARMEDVKLVVKDDGMTAIDPAGKTISCAMEWKDLGAYEDFLVKRLGGSSVQGAEGARAGLAAAVLGVLLVSCKSAPPSAGPFATIWGCECAVDAERYERIEDPKRLGEVWAECFGQYRMGCPYALLDVSPCRSTVLVIFGGQGSEASGILCEEVLDGPDTFLFRFQRRGFQRNVVDIEDPAKVDTDRHSGPRKPFGFFVLPNTPKTIVLEEDVGIGAPPVWKEQARLAPPPR